MLATAYAHAGRRKDALSLINELKKSRQRDYVPSGAFISSYLALGDTIKHSSGVTRPTKSNLPSYSGSKYTPSSIPCATTPGSSA
jgi:hypothetical protein